MARDGRRPGDEDRTATPDLHGPARRRLHADRRPRRPREDHQRVRPAARPPHPRRPSKYSLTTRRGAKVSRERFDHLDDAVAALERSAESIRGEGGLEGVSLVRDFAPGDRVAARLEVSTGRWFRSRTAGVDVMGDGSLVAFAGGM